MRTQPVAILLIDANKLFRQALKCLFDGRDFTVAGEAGSVAEAASLAASGVPADLVLLDPMAASAVEHDAVSRMRAVWPDARIVVLTAGLDSSLLAEALKAGADGYLLKDMSVE